MNPFDSTQYASQLSSQDHEHARRNSFPARTTAASVGLHTGQGNINLGITFDMSATQSVVPPQGQTNQSNPQTARVQQTSMDFGATGGDTMGTYQFNPMVTQGNDTLLFTGNEHMSIQQFQQNRELYQDADSFSLNATYDPTSFTPAMDPMAAFQQGYTGTVNFQENDMTFPLGYDAADGAQPQSLDMLFANSTFVPLPQSSMQPTTAPEQLITQHNWVDLSNFNLSLPGQRIKITSPVGSGSQQSSLVSLPRRSQSTSQPQSMSPFMQQQPPKAPITSPSFRNPFIPSEVAASTTPKPGAGKVASEYYNIYSSSGFDMFGILAKIASRPNPEIDIGAVDMSCAFILCDITSHDDPIIYVSDAFERLTGYTRHEILGRNCRFLQSPDGKVDPGTKRKYVDNQTVYRLKEKIQARAEVQVSMINYRKGGQSFMNLLTMIPINWNSTDYRFYVGFQVDLVEQPHAVTKRNADGSYSINYQRDQLSRYVLHAPESRKSQTAMSRNISHNEATSILRTIGAGIKDGRFLDRVILENSDDVIHVLSLKGLFLYLSQSSSKILEYDPSELVGRSISSVCHPSDIAPVTRELKQSTAGSPVSVIYRFRRKNSGYVWFESYGSLHIEPGKGRKCLILVGRERPVYALDRSSVLEAGGIGENDLWTKISISGMFLFVSSNARALLDRTPAEMVGKGIQEFMRSDSRGELGKALEVARTGRQATFKHEIRHKRGNVLQAQTALFPGDATPGTKPSFLIARIYLLKNSRSTYLQQRNSPIVLSTTTTKLNNRATSAGTIINTTTALASQSNQKPATVATEAGSHGLPLGTQDEAMLSGNNIFEELKTVRSSSWQFELRQLEKNNRLLAEELQGLLSRRKKRKRKKGTGPLEKECISCHTRNTPEWRRGPSGHRDLCNSCGLRWAKQNGRISPRKPSDQRDKTSSPASGKASPGSLTDEKAQSQVQAQEKADS
ncbi:GATA transcription factor LreA [Talaromyces stipitatus ATCC 10500]|uniref:GATA transcription factor LreA n=1 Tax=Talaromyces stipitatus (strain ATCC 10500 / CBS 375.48 / QM 6759 / NRRL 1006) TaxID=441959 RepID=B8MNP5_TALSN|nr:GATA transcription factor LreA [Talaromyces stipitatus ATCC 10500]EED14134.1 GATA transcription factor LreA [Talaromyces stipitatus ATCC 10500]